jgi:HD-GYP domain-containing protein (c-di-GMP phosphodiesterase class II)
MALSSGLFSSSTYRYLLDAGVADLYIKLEEMDEYLRYLDFYRLHLDRLPSKEMHEQATAFYHSASSAIAWLFENGADNPGAITQVKMIAETTLSEVIGSEKSIKALMKVCSHDYYTYTHSLDVAIYAIGIGMSLGLEDATVRRLSFSALMHDIGKCRLSLKILNKKGTLSREEFEAMKSHPEFGYEIMVQNGEDDPDILAGIRYHHERYYGGGYPANLQGETIPLFARIVAVADVFNALTTRRSYKPALSTFDAFTLMKQSMGDHLDPVILDAFIAFMGRG